MEPPALGVTIARKIAAQEGVEPATLEPPVQAVIDVAALEQLIHAPAHARTEFTGLVRFAYDDYTVTVDETGSVSVCPSSDLAADDDRRQHHDSCDTPRDSL